MSINASPAIGVPQSLLYYRYYPLWKTFFEELGGRVETSGPSCDDKLVRGSGHAHADSCVPIKLAFGHIDSLVAKGVDYLFLPKFFRLDRKSYVCPKVIGFNDMIKNSSLLDGRLSSASHSPYLIDELFDVHNCSDRSVFRRIGRKLGGDTPSADRAYSRALRSYDMASRKREVIFKNDILKRYKLKIGVIGHPYNVHDDFLSMGLLNEILKKGILPVTYEDMPPKSFECDLSKYPSDMFWSFGREIYRAALYFMSGLDFSISGLIYIAPFGCGLDSMLVSIVQAEAAARKMPFLNLTIDEHTARAGIMTRIEAFIDMIS